MQLTPNVYGKPLNANDNIESKNKKLQNLKNYKQEKCDANRKKGGKVQMVHVQCKYLLMMDFGGESRPGVLMSNLA